MYRASGFPLWHSRWILPSTIWLSSTIWLLQLTHGFHTWIAWNLDPRLSQEKCYQENVCCIFKSLTMVGCLVATNQSSHASDSRHTEWVWSCSNVCFAQNTSHLYRVDQTQYLMSCCMLTNAARHCYDAMSSGMMHFALQCVCLHSYSDAYKIGPVTGK